MKWIVLFTSLTFYQILHAQEAETQFEQANELYRNGKFSKAAELYEQIVSNGYEHAVLYYNLGNTYFKKKNIPTAILYYERAKRLAPQDEDILYNLHLANLRVVDKIESLPQLFFAQWWNTLISLMSSDGWGTVSIIGLWCILAGGSMYFISRSYGIKRIMFILSSLSILVVLFSFIAILQQYNRERTESHAIVFSPTISVKSSPDEQSTDLFVLHEGVKVEVLDTVGEWRKVRLVDGKVGWIVEAAIRII